MNSTIAREIVHVIRVERQRRSDRLKDEGPNAAYDRWVFLDEPFVNDMCLMVLVALRHEVERELLSLAARARSGATITRKQYQQNLIDERKELKKGWKNLIATLSLDSFEQWKTSMKTLQLLANCLKHEPTREPDKVLLNHLKLPLKPPGRLIVGYLPLPESDCFRKGLALSVGLPRDADYCTIAETFIDLADQFLEKVRQQTTLVRVTGKVSISEFAC